MFFWHNALIRSQNKVDFFRQEILQKYWQKFELSWRGCCPWSSSGGRPTWCRCPPTAVTTSWPLRPGCCSRPEKSFRHTDSSVGINLIEFVVTSYKSNAFNDVTNTTENYFTNLIGYLQTIIYNTVLLQSYLTK